MKKSILFLILMLATRAQAFTSTPTRTVTPTPTFTVGRVIVALTDSGIEEVNSKGIGIGRRVITDVNGTPIPTAVPGSGVESIGNTVNVNIIFTPVAPLPISGQVTVVFPSSTNTPVGGHVDFIGNTVNVNILSIIPTNTPLPAAGLDVNPKSTPAAAWPVSLTTPIVVEVGPGITAIPTASAEGAYIPIRRDRLGNIYAVPSNSNGAPIIAAPSDNQNSTGLVVSQSYGMLFAPGGLAGVTASERVRASSLFNCLTITASGSTVLIGPNTNGGNSPLIAGNKWRIFGYKISMTGDVTDASGDVYIKFIDNATTMGIAETFDTPTAALTNAFGITTGWTSLGNGIPSASANNALNVNLSSTLATGVCTVCVAWSQAVTP